MNYPINKIRKDFPILEKNVGNHSLVYLDSAASAQKPNIVIESESNFYRTEYSAVHRAIHTLGSKATTSMESIRSKVANFINAKSEEEIIFVKGTTEGINLIANTLGKFLLSPGDNIVITEMEHHSNIVPWQMIAKEKQLFIRFIPLLLDGTLDFSKLSILIDQKTRLLSITQVSNVLGTVNPLSDLIEKIRKMGNIIIVIDGAQSIMHQKVDVQALNCDFYVFSGHKMYGPSGIGILYGKKSILENMPAWEGGGSMIRNVNLIKGTTFSSSPWRFEAGSPNITGIIGLGSAIDYIRGIGLDSIQLYEYELMNYTVNSLRKIPDLIIYGPDKRIGVISFNLNNHHAYDVGIFLDQYGIAIRTGHHCAMPLMEYFQVSSMCRISLAMYNTKDDIDQLALGLIRIQKLLK